MESRVKGFKVGEVTDMARVTIDVILDAGPFDLMLLHGVSPKKGALRRP
jgi:hypothetical protein